MNINDENIEKVFEDFINALRNLSKDEIDKLYDNMKRLNELEGQNNDN